MGLGQDQRAFLESNEAESGIELTPAKREEREMASMVDEMLLGWSEGGRSRSEASLWLDSAKKLSEGIALQSPRQSLPPVSLSATAYDWVIEPKLRRRRHAGTNEKHLLPRENWRTALLDSLSTTPTLPAQLGLDVTRPAQSL